MYRSTDRNDSEVRRLAARLFTEKRRYLLAIARRNASRDADAEEALQDAFVSFIAHFDPDSEAPPLAWLTLTLKRECWARSRRSLRHTGAQEPIAVAPGPGQSIERSEAVIEARERLAQLKPAERRALGLIGAGYSYREVGEITGWTYTKVNRCASEGRAVLRSNQGCE